MQNRRVFVAGAVGMLLLVAGCAPSPPESPWVRATGNVRPGVTIYFGPQLDIEPLGKVLEINPQYQDPKDGTTYEAVRLQRTRDQEIVWFQKSMFEIGRTWHVRRDDPALAR